MYFDAIAKTVAERTGCDVSVVKPESRFVDLGIDSLDTVELLMSLEDELGIEDKISAVVRKIYGGRGAVLLPEAKKQAMAYLAPVQTHLLEEGCIGSISEIFDGDAPHTCRGCYAQAWSVGEILRCYTQDIQKNQK